MLKRMGQLLERVRGAKQRPVTPETPPKKWVDDLAQAGFSADGWIAERLAAGRLFVDLTDERVVRLSELEPAVTQAAVEAASRVLRHEFNLLGSGPYTPVDPDRAAGRAGYQPIDWYLDPVSGLRFPRGIPHKEWNLEQMRPGLADIKLPWELGRCQHWPVLGEAYRLTGDDRYAMEIGDQLRDFMDANPVGTGVNWTCTMDVAIRAANWALALELVRSCAGMPVEFWREAYDALFDHGVFIERNLENTFEVTSNHFLSNIVGLFYLAVVFSDLPQGKVWDRQCRTWLEQEMTVQVLPDGADYESSVPYHRLVTELFLGAARLAEHTGRPLSQSLNDRLGGMVEFLAAVLRPDGLMPQVGDADDGRLHVLSGYGDWQPQDPGHLFGPAACFFRNPDWTQLAGRWGVWEAAWWGFEIEAPAATLSRGRENPRRSVSVSSRWGWGPSAIEKEAPAATLSRGHEDPRLGVSVRQFANAGLVVIRQRGDYLLITNGIVGTAGFGNHKHNDLLGFEYHVAGEPVLVDPGSYVYTSDPDARNLFRSTRSHNTLSVDGHEQNEFRPEWLFRMFERAAPEHLSLVEDDAFIQYRGRHRGYAHLKQPVVHERVFTFARIGGALTIVDRLEGSGTHSVRWHFHFAPGVEVVPRESGQFDIRLTHGVVRMIAPAAMRSSVTPAWYSPSYGVRRECVALDFEVVERIDGCREYTFQIVP